MVNIITISIDRYNALYKRALQADALEKENAELRERLDNTMTIRSRTGGVTVGPKGIKSFVDSDKYINAVDGVELRNDTNKVTLDVIDFEVIHKEIEKLKEMNESLKMRLNDEKRLYEYKLKNEEEKHIGMIAKPIKGSKLRSRKRYATGGLATKGETW